MEWLPTPPDAKARAAGGWLVVVGSLAEGEVNDRSDIDLAILGVATGADERRGKSTPSSAGSASPAT
ncbi:MAG: nucleotidyltransferase domain-containing protein [Alphaproteobacteria bacterium]|nr:nucleotidyltransferase domain-containing protein [Alphaproteobacteria bacterium]